MAWKHRLGSTVLAAALGVPALAGLAAAQDVPPPAPAPAPAPAPEAPPAEPPAPAPAPEEGAPRGWIGVTTGEDVRLRAGPSINYRVLERLPKGSWLLVTGEDGEFLRVQVPGGVPVFVSGDLAEVGADGKTVTVAKSDVLLRPTPGQEYFPLEGQKLQKGDVCTLLSKEKGEKGDWLRVLPPARIEVFVHRSYVEKAPGEGDRTADLRRLERERRDSFTGGKESEAAKAEAAKREELFGKLTAAAASALAAAPSDLLPTEADRHRQNLTEVMTESGDPELRARAASVSKDYALRERTVLLGKAKAEKETVAGELDRRLAEVEEKYRKRMEEILKAAPRRQGPRFEAIGTVERRTDGTFQLVKGGVTLHRIDSLRYDLEELNGLRVGVNGTAVKVDPASGLSIFRVDGLEILE
jgi:hypothetical protein